MQTGSLIGDLFLNILLAIVIVLVGRVVVRWLIKIARKLMVRANIDPILINFTSTIANVILLLFVLIAALDQLGVDTTSMIAVLGAAGLAVGLAMKDSLQNFAAGVMLIINRPFKLDDFVEVAGVMGIVEKISIFSTIMRTTDNREVIVPNGQIYADTITNYSARDTRRIDMVFGISYDSDLLKAKQLLTDIVTAHPMVLADPAPIIRVGELADNSVNFIVWPWVNRSDFGVAKAELLEQVKLAFDANEITIPFPQMELHLNQPLPESGSKADLDAEPQNS
ncbi:Potassium efflux system KefA protein / Small-conductance mechanosensitive channel [Methylophaga frappieri]|uniref:Small-conductance mechanosensitive channel n=1 Tax=Methylophaga frappieri (strain ATCC BAA-2434 / DSM 25690 / JAM7) TaxID=754477 RepID=I1YK29_METFJ|nr:mechanosensitive ion channel domain-containing protein [Methylophaga frappieri]AFJ03272.1 Potassium efflux system KefA protein / Small-conductance mechanosensitive channel [Methylophaga frappieri]